MSDGDFGQFDDRAIPGGCEFFGAMTASVSHELNNVLSIIDQNIGLVEDMVRAEEQGRPMSMERLSQAVSAIHKQDQRGLEIIRRLNRFAHSADAAEMEFDVNEVVRNFAELTTRLVGLKQMSLTFSPHTEPLKALNRPFVLQQLLFTVMRPVLDAAVPERTIDITVTTDGETFVVTLSVPFKVAPGIPPKSARELVGALAAKMAVEAEDDLTRLRLTCALKLPHGGSAG